MKKPSNDTIETHATSPERINWLRILLALIIIYLVALFTPLVQPYAQLPLYFIKCGSKPVAASNFAAGSYYTKPDSGLWALTPSTIFFCSAEEAEAQGFRELRIVDDSSN